MRPAITRSLSDDSGSSVSTVRSAQYPRPHNVGEIVINGISYHERVAPHERSILPECLGPPENSYDIARSVTPENGAHTPDSPLPRIPNVMKYRARRVEAFVPRNANYWTPELEAVARHTMRQARGYVWMFDNMGRSAKVWSDSLNVLTGILGSIAGTTGLVSIFTSKDQLWIKLVQVLIGFMITVVSVLTSTWRLTEQQMDGLQSQSSYANLEQDIMWQIAQPKKDRKDAREYVKEKLDEIEQIKLNAPMIDLSTKAQYTRLFKVNPIYSPTDHWDTIIADSIKHKRSSFDTKSNTGMSTSSSSSSDGSR